mgnify:FL=1|jgi:mannose-6-phosphate isomerase-like protein (cupin superfamily)|tara:strand:+ start:6535 stop:6855 length:321 start_codon:yes stop_codon:yes gene_type:complete
MNRKVWGSTELIFSNETTTVHRAFINKNGQSSRHYHKHKSNLFYVESGFISVTVWDDSGKREVFLREGEKLSIQPNIWHRFKAIEDSIILEIYAVTIDLEDIVRDV